MEFFSFSLVLIALTSIFVDKEFVKKDHVESEKLFIVDDSSYKCNQVQKLGEIPRPKTIIVREPVPCPKCKPTKVKAPCGDDRKIFPVCEATKP